MELFGKGRREFAVTDDGIDRCTQLTENGAGLTEQILSKEAFVEAFNKYVGGSQNKTACPKFIELELCDSSKILVNVNHISNVFVYDDKSPKRLVVEVGKHLWYTKSSYDEIKTILEAYYDGINPTTT